VTLGWKINASEDVREEERKEEKKYVVSLVPGWKGKKRGSLNSAEECPECKKNGSMGREGAVDR